MLSLEDQAPFKIMTMLRLAHALLLGVLTLHWTSLTGLAADSTSAPPPNLLAATDVPVMGGMDRDGKPSKTFLALHESFLKRSKSGPIGLLFIGDSITAGWVSGGKDIWQQHYGAYNPANFGIGGIRTQNVLWQIQNGELDGISPKVVVLLIGTNNGSKFGVASVTRGVRKVVEQIHAKLPKSKVLLLGIFPRGNDPASATWVAKGRAFIAEVNKDLATLDDGKQTRFLDIGPKFMDSNGVISKDVISDGVHPARRGYQIWADAMQPLLEEMLKDET